MFSCNETTANESLTYHFLYYTFNINNSRNTYGKLLMHMATTPYVLLVVGREVKYTYKLSLLLFDTHTLLSLSLSNTHTHTHTLKHNASN